MPRARASATTASARELRARRFEKTPPAHWVYVVRCADGTLYTGYARDPEKRTAAHNAGRGAKYTAGRRPVTLVYSESFSSRGKALTREWELKRRSRADKSQLIASAGSPRRK